MDDRASVDLPTAVIVPLVGAVTAVVVLLY
jgi:hypothetical protein